MKQLDILILEISLNIGKSYNVELESTTSEDNLIQVSLLLMN